MPLNKAKPDRDCTNEMDILPCTHVPDMNKIQNLNLDWWGAPCQCYSATHWRHLKSLVASY